MSDNNQTVDYYIAPKESFDATADAIRAVTGESGEIEWKSNGFADAIGDERTWTADKIATHDISGDIILSCTNIFPYSFYGANITSISAPNVIYFSMNKTGGGLGSYIFAYCDNLESVSLPNLTDCGNGGYQFVACKKLTSVYMPKSTTGQHMFEDCTSLVNVAIPFLGHPSASNLNSYAFNGCSSLEKVDIGFISMLHGCEFQNCPLFKTLILRRSDELTALKNISAFNGTPFASNGIGGTIYIPEILYNHLGDGTTLDYQSATNWSTIHGYGTITWQKIEGSIYETQYADGTPVGGAS